MRQSAARDFFSDVMLGAALGAIVLGVGGRVVMRLIALATAVPAGFSVGGTVTVVALGAVSGAAGGLLRAAGHGVATRLAPGRRWARHLLFALLLGCVTLRGLRGTPVGPAALFVPLVVVYGVLLNGAVARRRRLRVREVPSDADLAAHVI